MAVALAFFQCAAFDNHEPHAGDAFQALAGGGDDRVKRRLARVDLDGAERAHGVDDQAASMFGDDQCDLVQGIEHAGAGLAVNQRDMGD